MMDVDVYWNLHKSVWSVRNRKTGKVVLHAPSLVLYDCTFVVQPAGRDRVRREGKKNVHAFVRGTYVDGNVSLPDGGYHQVMYNPYKYDNFVYRHSEEVAKPSKVVQLTTNRQVWALVD